MTGVSSTVLMMTVRSLLRRYPASYYALAALAYFAMARLAELWNQGTQTVQPFYPAAGAAVAAAILSPRRHRLPVAAFGSAAGVAANNLFLDATVGDLLIDIGANTTETVIAVLLAWALLLRNPDSSVTRTVAWLAASAAAALVGAMIGFVGWSPRGGTSFIGRWVLGDGLGIFLVAPLALVPYRIRIGSLSRRVVAEVVGTSALLAIATVVAFGTTTPVAYIVLPLLIWLCLRAATLVGAVAALLIVIYACAVTSLGHGPFSVDGREPVLQVQAFNAAVGISAALVGAHTESARRNEAQTRAMLSAMPDMVVLTNHRGEIARQFSRPADLATLDVGPLVSHLDTKASLGDPVFTSLADQTPVDIRDAVLDQQVVESRTVSVGDGSALSVIRDITELVTQAQALAASDDRWRNILEASQEGIIEVDNNAEVLYASPRLGEMIGIPAESLIGLTLDGIIGADTWEAMVEPRATVRSGSPVVTEVKAVSSTGEPLWGLASSSPKFYDDGSFAGALLFVTDITAFKAAEQERIDLMDELADVERSEQRRLARELHDGPLQDLTAVHIMLGHLSRTSTGDDRDIARKAADAMTDALATVRAGVFALDPADIDGGGLGKALRSHAVRAAGAAPISVELHDDAPRIRGPVAQVLYRIGREAITNAARHAKPSTLWITIGEADDTVSLTIEDDGTGFDSSAPYRVGHMGLRSMHERAAQANGTLTISSSDSGGTCVALKISSGSAL